MAWTATTPSGGVVMGSEEGGWVAWKDCALAPTGRGGGGWVVRISGVRACVIGCVCSGVASRESAAWHTWAIISCAGFAPDGRTVAAGGSDFQNWVRLWDASTGKESATLSNRDKDTVESVAFSPDSKALAAGRSDGSVTLWDIGSGKERFTT